MIVVGQDVRIGEKDLPSGSQKGLMIAKEVSGASRALRGEK